MLYGSIYSSKLLPVKIIVMDTQEACDSEGGKSTEETKNSRNGNNKNYLNFIKVLRREDAQRLC